MLTYFLIILFAVADHLLTYWEIQLGLAIEGNPLLIGIMSLPLELSILVRISWIAALLLLLWYLSRYKPKLVRYSVLFLAVLYYLLIVYHVVILIVTN